ncbi:MAG: hypothetical protein RMJ16_00530 [Thermoguttaceae bacterium]|nr:hypothetical protein [Thermoguttaceae bacterium]
MPKRIVIELVNLIAQPVRTAALLCVSCVGWVLAIVVSVPLTLAEEVPITAETSRGESLVGKPIKLADGRLELASDEGQVLTFAFAQLERLLVGQKGSRYPELAAGRSVSTKDSWEVALVGGSRLRCQEVELSPRASQLRCKLANGAGRGHEISLKAVAFVLFRQLEPSFRPQWEELEKSAAERDRLVVTRGEFLDYYPGTVVAISPGQVTFQIEGETLDVPISRLVGILLAASGRGSTGLRAACCVEHRGGSVIWAASISATSEEVRLVSVEDQAFAFPWDELVVIDFSRHRQIPLSSLPVVEEKFEPFVPIPGLEENLARILLPPLGKTFEPVPAGATEDLTFPAGASVTWRLPEGATHFRGTVEAVSKLTRSGLVAIRLFVDERLVFERDLPLAQPEALEVPVAGGKILRLKVSAVQAAGFGFFIRVRNGRVILGEN